MNTDISSSCIESCLHTLSVLSDFLVSLLEMRINLMENCEDPCKEQFDSFGNKSEDIFDKCLQPDFCVLISKLMQCLEEKCQSKKEVSRKSGSSLNGHMLENMEKLTVGTGSQVKSINLEDSTKVSQKSFGTQTKLESTSLKKADLLEKPSKEILLTYPTSPYSKDVSDVSVDNTPNVESKNSQTSQSFNNEANQNNPGGISNYYERNNLESINEMLKKCYNTVQNTKMIIDNINHA